MLPRKFCCFSLLDLFFAFWTKSGLWCSSASTTHKTTSFFFPPSFIFPPWDGCVLPVASADAPSLCLLLPLHQGMQLCACAHPAFTNTDGETNCWRFLNMQQSRNDQERRASHDTFQHKILQPSFFSDSKRISVMLLLLTRKRFAAWWVIMMYGSVLFKRNHRAAMSNGRKPKSCTLQNIQIYVRQPNINNSSVLF